MENLVNQKLFSGVYEGKKVFLTGHTGFKGSWMMAWLEAMGAEVCGYSLEAPTNPNHLELLNLKGKSVIGDIRDIPLLEKTMSDFNPEVVFHMAAQPLVRLSYDEPHETFETNVMGSLNIYEASRKCSSVRTIVTITTDKVYENNEWVWGYRESDRLGGKDPYSASKAAMEIMTSSYRNSFFHLDKYGKDHHVLMGVVRAGNVIGGGDWAKDRLIPDIIKASLEGNPVSIRSPHSVRPWQHVLEPISGYLLLGQKLIENKKEYAKAFNFGPLVQEEMTVQGVLEHLKKYWDKIDYKIEVPKDMPHEAGLLKLDCTMAKVELDWSPVWTTEEGLQKTIEWYKAYNETEATNTYEDLTYFISNAKERKKSWI
ncbi:MAG: CDP-glucose 4,6-dehydratase [Bacteriovoracaceae bacterium]|nr:CDP-glucose 4,6-dehydratase [Bacteriovoracaceae bacterium]